MNLHSHPLRGDCTSPTWTEGPRTQHRKAPEDTRPAPTAQEAQLVPTALATGSLARALAPPSGPHARTPRGCPQLHRSYSALLLVRSISHLRLRCGAVVWPWESSCGARLSCDEGQSLQAVGRAAQTRGSRGSTMAVAVRAAGYLPALCGAPSGESRDAGRGLRVGSGRRQGVRPGRVKRGPSRRPPSRPDPPCDLARFRALSGSQASVALLSGRSQFIR